MHNIYEIKQHPCFYMGLDKMQIAKRKSNSLLGIEQSMTNQL